ncbi:MAG TPA: aldose 1-epimerase family protein [Pseudolysinimonas sp.]|nr:aldose 1-epimerase family protein [Pseudolysinimonas sp.]
MTAADPAPFSRGRIVLDNGTARAEIGLVAAVLCGLSVDGVRLTETVPRDALPPMGCGIVLAPWPNRVRDGRWRLDGETQQLDLTEPALGNASHGLLRNTAYHVIDQAPDAVTLGAVIPPQHGWPFPLETWVRYTLEPDGLAVTHGARNTGNTPALWAVGAHPYFRIGETPVEQLTLRVDRPEYLELDDRLIPVSTRPVEGTRFDLRQPRTLAGVDVNVAYGDSEAFIGRSDAAWLESADGSRLALWLDEEFSWIQVYTPRDFPRSAADGGSGIAVAIEPMSAAPDALNSRRGLSTIPPAGEWQASWGVRYAPAAAL